MTIQLRLIKVIIVFIICYITVGYGQIKKYYFYHPENNFGSELYFNPATTFMNGSFDILRNGGHTKDLTEQHYKANFKNVWENISDPLNTIDQYGWDHFISEEIFPLGLDKEKSQFVPNYLHHLIGSGMLYVKMAEWYDYHGAAYPRVYSALTSMFYHYLNEAMENHSFVGNNPDPVADLLIFDPLSILLFSSGTVKRFFSEKLQLYDWSLQPVYNPVSHNLENAGQQFVMLHRAPYTENFSVFYYYGIYGITGLSYNYKEDYNISFGGGIVVNKLQENRRRKSRFLTPKIDGALGLFYDRNRSLLFSVLVTGPKMYNVQINIYPGYCSLGWFKPGIFIGAGEIDRFLIGLSLAHIPVGVFGN